MCCGRTFVVYQKEVTAMTDKQRNINTDVEISVIIAGVIYALLLVLAIAQASGAVL